MRNLTVDEARERALLLKVSSYDVHLDLRDDTGFTSTTEVRFTTSEPGADTFLELDAEVVALTRNGRETAPEVSGNRIALRDLAASEVVRVTARCSYSRTGEGLQRSVDPADGRVYLYSQAFLDEAQRMLACFDQPDLKAVLRLTVEAPPEWTVLATMRATVTDHGSWRTHAFAETPPLPSYLFAVAAGPWHGVHLDHDGIELGAWCRQSVAEHFDADEILELTARSLDLQQQLFGCRYPFGDTYDQVFVPDFNGGAMENPGMVTFSEELYVFSSRVTHGKRRQRGQVIAHELAHMWFGNLVTMRWWDDLWLNESFAELLGVLTVDRALPYDGAWDDFGLGRKAWGYRADQLPTTHPVADDVPDTRAALLNFDGISYAKGAAVLRQLMAAIGEDAFFAGVRDYVATHAFGNTSLADLLVSLERASGRDLAEWSRLWLRTSGVSTLQVAGGSVVQTGEVLRPHRIGIGRYDEVGGSLRLRERLDVEVSGARTAVPDLGPGLSAAALVLPNDGDLTFATIRFDDTSLATVLRSLGTLDDPLARVVAWGGLWDSCRSAELSASDFVDGVLAHVGAETDTSLVETLLLQARTAATLYTDDPDVVRDLHEHLARALLVEAPGGDVQLLLVRAAIETASSPELLLGWLDGPDLPAGVALDADLRWHLLDRLAAIGGIGLDRIEAAHAADRTDAGDRGAARARAALPDPAAKEAAWGELLGDPAISTARARAIGAGFWQHGQDLGGFVPRFFTELPVVFDQRSPTVGPTLARLGYPRTVVEQDVLDRTDALLERELAPALRRTTLEVRDDLARAVAARAR